MPAKRKKTNDAAAAQLYRLAQAQTLIDSVRAGREPVYDSVGGKVTPTREAIDQVNRENPELLRRSNEEG